ncbi:MAG: glutamine synthetase type III, partial [Bacteroidales bacterium]|nr:glutamine synthetase type III [Bacteroidales bacterium]
YSEAWQKEAKRRGLDTETSVPKMFKSFTEKQSVELFTRLGIYSEKELEARNDVKWETYIKKVQIEARMTARMATNHIIPAGLEYQRRLLENVDLMRQNFAGDAYAMSATTQNIIREISTLIGDIESKVKAMSLACEKANGIADIYEQAEAYHGIAESLFGIRKSIDDLEEITDNDLWPLPKYREILFIN